MHFFKKMFITLEPLLQQRRLRYQIKAQVRLDLKMYTWTWSVHAMRACALWKRLVKNQFFTYKKLTIAHPRLLYSYKRRYMAKPLNFEKKTISRTKGSKDIKNFQNNWVFLSFLCYCFQKKTLTIAFFKFLLLPVFLMNLDLF